MRAACVARGGALLARVRALEERCRETEHENELLTISNGGLRAERDAAEELHGRLSQELDVAQQHNGNLLKALNRLNDRRYDHPFLNGRRGL